jgi:hypothetical protein
LECVTVFSDHMSISKEKNEWKKWI